MSDTIYALSSGAPPAALAIIRISGPHAFDAVRLLCGALPEPRRASLRTLKDSQGQQLDESIVIIFPGPNSASGEDLAELHLHGGRAVVRAVENSLGAMDGLRKAEAGEYTRRAFENGVMDLNQADALSDLLFAETERQRKSAITMMDGFGSRILEWQQDLLKVSALIESELDFSDEDDVDSGSHEKLLSQSISLTEQIDVLLDAPPVERLRDGIKIVLGGPPNSGKSTLLNALTQREAAIVSDVAGTTRDIIEIPVSIGGIAFLFLDTAGVREDSDDDIEKIGIRRAEQAFEAADIILWLGDGSPKSDAKIIYIAPKSDIIGYHQTEKLSLSAKTGEGLESLKAELIDLAQHMIPGEDSFALNKRQRDSLRELSQSLKDMQHSDDWLIMGEYARIARLAMDRLTGASHTEELLDTIFGQFCIGK